MSIYLCLMIFFPACVSLMPHDTHLVSIDLFSLLSIFCSVSHLLAFHLSSSFWVIYIHFIQEREREWEISMVTHTHMRVHTETLLSQRQREDLCFSANLICKLTFLFTTLCVCVCAHLEHEPYQSTILAYIYIAMKPRLTYTELLYNSLHQSTLYWTHYCGVWIAIRPVFLFF